MEIKRLLNALWRKAWVMIILAALGGGITSYFTVYRAVPMYRAECTLYVFNIDKVLQKGQTLTQNDLNYSLALVQNFSELIKSRRVTSQAAVILKNKGVVNINEEMLAGFVSLGTQKQSNIIVVSSVSTDPEMAALISNAMGKAFVDTLNGLTNSKSIDILDAATVPRVPVSNNSYTKILAGILIGAILGFGIIYLQAIYDTTVRYMEDVEQGLNIKVIGIIPQHKIK